ncbi:hypothetical protein EJ110_NYTH01472 [Nymphaea thermarum]|nr:hypothetical protein EJ110_NYTH01472 [Nymphaea thermarum]
MDDGEIDFSNQDIFADPLSGGTCTLDSSMFEEFFKDTHACTHTHTCNPPGPDHTHTHTCFHVHTKIVPPADDEKTNTTDETAESVEKPQKKRPSGNREAVRRYREKKKDEAARLNHEVTALKAQVQHLTLMLQGKTALEAENARLKSLLVDIRGRIEGEIGSFPYQKPRSDKVMDGASTGFPGGYILNPCNLQCGDDTACLGPGFVSKNGGGCVAQENGSDEQRFGVCGVGTMQCQSVANGAGVGAKEFAGCSYGNVSPTVVPTAVNKKKRARGASVEG